MIIALVSPAARKGLKSVVSMFYCSVSVGNIFINLESELALLQQPPALSFVKTTRTWLTLQFIDWLPPPPHVKMPNFTAEKNDVYRLVQKVVLVYKAIEMARHA